MKKLVLVLIALMFTTSLHYSQVDEEKSNASDKEFIRVSIDGSVKEFGVNSTTGVLGVTTISGLFDGAEGEEALLIKLPGTETGVFDPGGGASAMYMGSGGTWQANKKAVKYGARLIVEIHEYEEYAIGTFYGTLVRVDVASRTWLTLELENGEFSIPVIKGK